MPAAVRTAVDTAYAAAKTQPESAAASHELGMVLQALGQSGSAARCYARASALDPKRYDTLYLWSQTLAAGGDHKSAVNRLQQALKVRGTVAAQVALSNELREAADLNGSAAIARDLLRVSEANATAHYLLGRATNSEAELRRAIALFPRYGAARFALATLLRRAGKPDEANEFLRDYERDKLSMPPVDDPESARVAMLSVSPTGILRRAVQEEAAGRLAEAADLERQALALQPDLVDAWVNLISLNARLKRDADAEGAYQKAVALAPGRADVHYNYGVFLVQKERYGEASQAFQRTLEAAPSHAEAAMNLGGILAMQGQFSDAAAMLRKATESQPGFAQAHFELGRILAHQRRIPQAIAELQQAESLASQNGQRELASVTREILRKLR